MLLARGSTLTHSISPPWESFRANFKAYTCLTRPVYQAAGRASHAMLLWAAWDCPCCSLMQAFGPPWPPSHPSTTRYLSHTQSSTGTVLLTRYGSQLQRSCPSLTLALLTSCCPKPHGVEFWSKCYSPIAPSHFQRRDLSNCSC